MPIILSVTHSLEIHHTGLLSGLPTVGLNDAAQDPPALVEIEFVCGCKIRWRGMWLTSERRFLPESGGPGTTLPALLTDALRAGPGDRVERCCADLASAEQVQAAAADDRISNHGSTYGPLAHLLR